MHSFQTETSNNDKCHPHVKVTEHKHFEWFSGIEDRSGGAQKEPVSSVNKKSNNNAANFKLGVRCNL